MRDLNHTFEIIKSIRLLVLVSFNTSLCLHPQPINVVVYHDPQWSPHLAAGFALRCFQRLSRQSYTLDLVCRIFLDLSKKHFM